MEQRLGVKAYVEQEEMVLLVKETGGEFSSFHTLPGGGVRDGETPEEALKRELLEELDVGATVGECLGMCSYEHRSMPRESVYLIFDCTIEGEPIPQSEEGILDKTWAPPHNLPDDCFDCIQVSIEEFNGNSEEFHFQGPHWSAKSWNSV